MIFTIIPTRFSAQNTSFSIETHAQEEYVQYMTHSSSDLQSLVEGENGLPVACSCIKTARSLGVDLSYNTDASDLVGNTTIHVGALALFKFPNGVSHVALIDILETNRFHVKQGNKTPCEITEEWIDINNPYIVGFFDT